MHSYLSGHLPRHILGSLCVLEGLLGLGAPGALAGHSHLVLLAQGKQSQGALEARAVLITGRRQKDSFSQRQMCVLRAS